MYSTGSADARDEEVGGNIFIPTSTQTRHRTTPSMGDIRRTETPELAHKVQAGRLSALNTRGSRRLPPLKTSLRLRAFCRPIWPEWPVDPGRHGGVRRSCRIESRSLDRSSAAGSAARFCFCICSFPSNQRSQTEGHGQEACLPPAQEHAEPAPEWPRASACRS